MSGADNAVTDRKCRKCSVVQPLDAFYKDSSGLLGRRRVCRLCMLVYCRTEEAKARHRENLKKNYSPGNRYRESLRVRYGATQADIDSFLLTQNGDCPICQYPLNAKFVVDHSHESGKIRGLLHSNCNVLLGMAKDSPVILGRAQAYLLSGGV